MMWFFAILIVLALAASPSSPPAAAPRWPRCTTTARTPASRRTGPLAGDDLRRVRFSLAFRGYRMSEVDALLDRLATELEARQAAEAAAEGEQPPTSEGRGGEPTD